MAVALDTPILDGGIRNTHWFQGRLLAAEDLQTEQEARRTHDRALGQALGAGVICGLMVELPDASEARVLVRQGSGLNRLGELIRLNAEVVLELAAPAGAAGGTDAALFRACTQPTGAGTIDGDGVYLLAVRPASGYQERAPASGLESNGKVTGCGSRYATEGVSFRLVPWVPTAPAGADPLVDLLNDPAGGNLSLIRNWVAHRFLGGDAREALAANPFAAAEPKTLPGQPGALSDLYRAGQIDDCDLPLALVYWPAGGIRYVDPWPPRRAPAPEALEARWAPWTGPGAAVAGCSRFSQFQLQLDWLLAAHTGTGPADLRALRDLRFLPPLALLPVHPQALGLPTGVGARGIDPAVFFDGIPTAPLRQIDGTLLTALTERSLRLPAVDLSGGELIQVLQTTQNAAGVSAGTAPPCWVAAAADLTLDLSGRLDAGRFDRSDFA